MKCPLSIIPIPIARGGFVSDIVDCLQEECAWWDGHGGFCAILKITRHLESLKIDADNIAKVLTLIRPSRK